MRRAVTSAGRRTRPALGTGRNIVSGQMAGGGDHDLVFHHQRRTREAPAGDLDASVGRRVARPHDRAVRGFERIQNSGWAKCVHMAVMEGGRRARTRTGMRVPESSRVAVGPYWISSSRVITGD